MCRKKCLKGLSGSGVVEEMWFLYGAGGMQDGQHVAGK